jgi:hypothetical protein
LPSKLRNAVSSLFRSEPKRALDDTPTGDEEFRDWNDQLLVSGENWDENAARIRIDRIARALALGWSSFLVWVILAQGYSSNHHFMWLLPIHGEFHLETSEFIAVVTTTTASVFGFLIIVARDLFSGKKGG